MNEPPADRHDIQMTIVRLYFSQFFLSIPIFFIQTRGNDLFVEGKVADTAEKPPVHLHAKYPEKL